MRTGLHINKQEVLSACLKEDGLSLQHPILTIQKAIDDLKWGNGSETKDFIKPKAQEMKISRKNGCRRRAANIYLEKLQPHVRHEIYKGMITN